MLTNHCIVNLQYVNYLYVRVNKVPFCKNRKSAYEVLCTVHTFFQQGRPKELLQIYFFLEKEMLEKKCTS
jgi:hypothetical protein